MALPNPCRAWSGTGEMEAYGMRKMDNGSIHILRVEKFYSFYISDVPHCAAIRIKTIQINALHSHAPFWHRYCFY